MGKGKFRTMCSYSPQETERIGDSSTFGGSKYSFPFYVTIIIVDIELQTVLNK
jgi:hypothetical protein